MELTGHRVRKLTVNAVSLPQSNLDSDGDGIADHSDTCPLIADATNADTDGDGLGDACEIPQQDLLAFYGFDNSTVDSSVFGRTATLQNGPGYTVDRHGQSNGSIYLENNAANAVNGSPVVGNAGKYITAPSVTLGPSITLGGWVKVESLNLWQRLFDFADGQAQNNLYLALNNSNRYFSLAGYNSASEVYRGDISAATIELDHWYHVVAVANAASDTATLYLNGVAVGSTSYNTDIPTKSRSGHWFGRSQWVSDSNRYLDGMLDDMVTYNRALTADDVSRLYLHGHNLQLRQSYVTGQTFSAFLSATIGCASDYYHKGMVPVAQELLAPKRCAAGYNNSGSACISSFVGTMLLAGSSATTVMPATVMAVQTSAQLKRVTRVAVSPTPAKTLMSVSPIPTTAMPMPPVRTPRARLPVPVMQASVAMAPAARRPPKC